MEILAVILSILSLVFSLWALKKRSKNMVEHRIDLGTKKQINEIEKGAQSLAEDFEKQRTELEKTNKSLKAAKSDITKIKKVVNAK